AVFCLDQTHEMYVELFFTPWPTVGVCPDNLSGNPGTWLFVLRFCLFLPTFGVLFGCPHDVGYTLGCSAFCWGHQLDLNLPFTNQGWSDTLCKHESRQHPGSSNSFPKTQYPTLFSGKPSSFMSQSDSNLTLDKDDIVVNIGQAQEVDLVMFRERKRVLCELWFLTIHSTISKMILIQYEIIEN
ncbi:hypothetical protein STEG23_026384, partial [Scotinomys teguina]